MAMPAPAPKMPPKTKTASAGAGKDRRSSRGRLEKNALEAALDDVYKEEEAEKGTAKVDNRVVHGNEKTGGVDPSFAAALHNKLVDQGGEAEPEPSGLRAPCTTCKLSPEELAKLADDDEDEGPAVHIHTQGAIDQVDSKLVTELQRKLCDQDQSSENKPRDANQKDDFAAALNKGLSAAVESGAAQSSSSHGAIDSINDALVMNLQKKLGAVSGEVDETDFYPEAESKSGLRAPQPTVKLSAQDLAQMDDEEEAVPGVAVETKSHGAIDLVNSALVTQLKQKLEDQTDEADAPAAPSGFRAPANTQKISADMMAALDDDDEDEAAAAPAMPGMAVGVDPSLVIELKRKLEDDDLEAAKDPKKIVKASGDPTVQLSADMLAALDLADEEEERQEEQKMADLKSQLNQQVGGGSSSKDKADQGFAADLARSLGQVSKEPASSGGGPEADLAAQLKGALTEVADKNEESSASGLKAPQCTEVITADMLAALDDDEPADEAAPGDSEGQIADAVSRLLGQEQTQESWSAVSGSDNGSSKKSNKQAKEKKKVNVGFRNSNSAAEPTAIMDALAQKLAGGEPSSATTAAAPVDAGDALPRAPANTMMLSEAQMAALDDDDEDIPMMESSNIVGTSDDVPSGTKAPASTTVLSNEQLAACWDDEGEEITEVPQKGMKAPHSTVVLSSELLDECNDDDIGDGEPIDTGPTPSGLKAPATTAVLTAEQLAQFSGEEDDEPVVSGMKAPHTTTVLTQDQLNMFDDEEEQIVASGTKAPHTTCMLRADDLAQLDDDVEEDTQENRALAAELQPAEDIATQVVQRVRDMPEAITDPWGNLPTAPVNSSCKLRLAWLSKDEIRKENDTLRKEIGQLRKEIEAHRKASLSQKA